VLDEVGELPLPVQAKLLRVLQEGEIQPVGSGRVERVNVRIVASTNRDLVADVKAGLFREDLYYRLAVVELAVPPLRDRAADIPALAVEFARRYADKFALGALVLADDLVAALALGRLARQRPPAREHHRPPGRARHVGPHHAGATTTRSCSGRPAWRASPLAATDGDGGEPDVPAVGGGRGPTLREQVEAFERGLIARALDATAGNQSEAARRLGVSRVTLIDKLRKYGLGARRDVDAAD
jgi:transcriptional regulator with GAF, ATPase, and Fis domain